MYLKQSLKNFILFVGCIYFFTPSVSYASHIVGGDMTYRFIERQGDNNRYIVRLNIYYDCYPPTNAPLFVSDSTITLAIYQRMTASPELWRLVGNNGSLRMLSVSRTPMTKVVNPTYECLVPPTSVCVSQGTFEFEVILKRISAPYVISYQRCCRNSTINNLINGDATGSNFYVEITPEAQELNNSSPTFRTYPPTLVCINEPLVNDHSVIDPDGDRIVYRFCQALTSPGLSGRPECFPSPTSSNYNCPPPFKYATYNTNYPFDKPMAGDPPIVLDTLTGMITGKPNSYGGYVISVCAEEYRGNVLIGRVFRDFQFNVVFCPKKAEVRLLDPDSTQALGDKKIFLSKCDSTTVTLLNNSRFLQHINSFYWEFNIAGQTRRFNDWHPKITFPDTGYYKGILWLNKGERCYDSAYIEVLVGSGLKANFDMKLDSCNASPIVLTHKTKNSYLPIKYWYWELGDTTMYIYDGTPSVSYQYRTTGLKQMKLTVVNKYGCKDDTVRTFYYQPMTAQLQLAATPTEGCIPTKVNFTNLTTPFDSTYKVKWDFGNGQSSLLQNPTHIYSQTGNFPVKLTVTNIAGCQKETLLRGGISIHTNPKADFDFTPKTVNTAKSGVQFEDKSSADATGWLWQFGNKGGSSSQNPNINFRDTGNINIRLVVSNTYGCTDTITKSLFVEPFSSFFLPNAFSPNNDGVNDVFLGQGYYDSFKSFSLQIFNRWGEIVFQTHTPTEGWNGQKNNAGYQLPEGVYLSVLIYKNYTGKEFVIKNYVHLTR
ncbi:MAG: gliding motility-associated C-terminal domain-containing protein [Saprospiraceae bacterium]|nr:gliding motility-associated C-terminal domain-containing protein [Saprospiraceae bacterium]